MQNNQDNNPHWQWLRRLLGQTADLPNKSLFKDAFGQAVYESLPATARWLIGLIPEKDFREKIMPLMKVGNFAIPALAVVIRQVTKLPDSYDGYISAIAAQLRAAINNRQKSTDSEINQSDKSQANQGQTNQGQATDDQNNSVASGLNPNSISLGLILLLIPLELQNKFFANFDKISDPEIKRQLLEMEFTFNAIEVATIKDNQENSLEFLEPVIKKVEGLANMTEVDFLIWVEAMIKKPKAKKSFFSSVKATQEKVQQAFQNAKNEQEKTIAALREKNTSKKEAAKKAADSKTKKINNWLKGF